MITNHLLKDEKFHRSHGAKIEDEYLGGSLLYYTLPYAYRSVICVCLGSGSGLVPRLMRQAQLDVYDDPDKAATILIDANLPEAGYGKPDYHEQETYFNNFDVWLWKMLTTEAVCKFADKTIDYLHIDADHSYMAVKNDLLNYLPKMSEKGIITLHDTILRQNCGVWQLIEEIRAANKWDVCNLRLGMGLAVLMHKRV
jgi:hypothetical protein